MPHGGGYREPVHPVSRVKQDLVVSGVWRARRKSKFNCSPLITHHSPLFLMFFRHGAGHVDHGQHHEDKGLEKTGEDRQSHDGQRQDERQ